MLEAHVPKTLENVGQEKHVSQQTKVVIISKVCHVEVVECPLGMGAIYLRNVFFC